MQCFYCGELPSQRDHVTPHAVTGQDKRHWSVDYVWACADCNQGLGAKHPFSLLDRCWHQHDRIIRKNRLNKVLAEWHDDELSEFSPMMARQIKAERRLRAIAHQRLAFIKHRIATMEMLEAEAIERHGERAKRRGYGKPR